MGRAEDTRERRRQILQAALDCFDAVGYEKTTLADIRDRAGASTGSIYHLFRSKEQLFAALYLEGIRETQKSALRVLPRASGAEEGVRALVRSYLRWVSKNRELACYLLTMRRAEFMGEAEAELEEMNRTFLLAVNDWLEASVRPGELPEIGQDLLLAILVGPSEDFARRWLRGKTTTSLRTAADTLAEAAWIALRGLR